MTLDLHGDFEGTFPFERRFVAVAPDVHLHFVDQGTGPPVVLLHGNPTWSYLYRNIIPPLAEGGFRAIAPDHMGFGRSDRPEGHARYTLRSHIDNLVAFLRALDLRDITLVMQDWGGPIGLGAAAREPERVGRLVVMNTWLGVLPEGTPLPFHEPFRKRGLGEILGLGGNMFVEAMFAGMRPASATPLVAEAYRAPFPDYYSRVPILAFARDVPLGDDHPSAGVMRDVAARAAELELPTLIIWGMRDRILPPAILEGWKGLYRDAEVVELPEARHYLQEDEPEAISQAILAFLRST